jgi:predicted phosphodiesterase
VAAEITRILSDLHYGDPASRVRSLAALGPLFAGADRIVFNGDTVETRPSPISSQTDEVRREFLEFARHEVPRCTLVTGNHDADLSDTHCLDLLGGIVFVTHGEVLFDELVPWSRELPQIRRLFREQLDALTPAQRENPGERLAAGKRACAQVQLPHDPHPRDLWQRVLLTARIFWPPQCTLAMIRAWHELPDRAAVFAREFRPGSRFVVVGHTHRPGVWVRPGSVVINTGSFRPPFGCYAVDVSPEWVVVRQVRHQQGSFSLGRVVASFALAPTDENSGAVSAILPKLAPTR